VKTIIHSLYTLLKLVRFDTSFCFCSDAVLCYRRRMTVGARIPNESEGLHFVVSTLTGCKTASLGSIGSITQYNKSWKFLLKKALDLLCPVGNLSDRRSVIALIAFSQSLRLYSSCNGILIFSSRERQSIGIVCSC